MTLHPLPRVLVFDSGVGGLSIFQAIARHLPGVSLRYLSDNAAFPYGTRAEDELIQRVEQVMTQALARIQPDLLVIACNTASTLTLPMLRQRFPLPVVGVVPAIKPAALLSRSKTIGLLATPATVARPYTHQLIADYASDCTVIPVGSSRLVHLAEQRLRGEPVAAADIDEVLQPFFQHPAAAAMDTLVLACTHFPLLAAELASALGGRVRLVDSGEAIARRVASLLPGTASSLLAPVDSHRAFFTAESPQVHMLVPALGRYGIGDTEILDIPFQSPS